MTAEIISLHPTPAQVDPFSMKRVDRIAMAKEIIAETAKAHGISVLFLTGESSTEKAQLPRRIAMKRIYAETGLALSTIGSLFSGRSHASVWHAIRKPT